MSVPDEDATPYWIRDYHSIEVDLRSLREYAAALIEELEKSYLPHRDQISRDMVVPCSPHDDRFHELDQLLKRHRETQAMATSLLTAHAVGTRTLGWTAETVSSNHGDADSFAKARASEVLGYMSGRAAVGQIGAE